MPTIKYTFKTHLQTNYADVFLWPEISGLFHYRLEEEKMKKNLLLNKCNALIRKVSYQHLILGACAFVYVFLLCTEPVMATDIWTKAEAIMKDVYGKILGISTIAAIVTASVALLLMNFSKSGKTVDESRAWLKRIVISWAILNSLGFIMAYITPFFSDGKWNG